MYSEKNVLSGLLTVMLLCSCSIREDREGCPSYLGLDLTHVKVPVLESLGLETLDIHVSDLSAPSYQTKTFRLRNLPDSVWLPVHKGEAGFMVLCGSVGECLDKEGIVIPEGQECPVVFGYGRRYAATEETCRDTVMLHKHSCMLNIRFVNLGNYEVEIEGGVNGFDWLLRPTEGLFSFKASTGWSDMVSICLPRQLDSSLLLKVSAGGKASSFFKLGAYLERSGYDWNAPDLEDISLSVNYTSSVITFRLDNDSKRYSLDVAI